MNGAGLYLGAMTGTSVDGLDLALLHLQPQTIEFRQAATFPLPAALREQLLALIQGGASAEVERLGQADTELGRFIAQTTNDFLKQHGIDPRDVSAIGSHGQTVRHRPDIDAPFTLQIGDANLIAELTGITTVADFRRRDMAAGGQAAPLVPLFHQALFGHDEETRTIVNIGGISNISVLEPGAPIRGHDTGPGNALLDAWCAKHTGRPYDDAGQFAAAGKVQSALLNQLLTDPYLHRSPPKSTGKEHYNLEWLSGLVGTHGAEDVQATLTAFTAQTIADDIPSSCERVVVCGGGRLNPVLLRLLRERLAVPVLTAEDVGADGDAIEAGAFAWLAQRRLTGLHGNVPSVTGARGERVLGAIYPA